MANFGCSGLTTPNALDLQCNIVSSIFSAAYPGKDPLWAQNPANPLCCCQESAGVNCNESSVTELKWKGTDANGIIDNLICDLTDLKIIDLSLNDLTGNFPDCGPTAEFSQLAQINLFGNKLSGSLPSFEGSYPNLVELNFGNNEFTGSFPFDGILKEAENTLTKLILRNNGFSGTVDSISGLKALQVLDLEKNKFSGSFPAIDQLIDLQTLELGSNEFSGPVPDFKGLTKLQILHLENNQFSGTIPDDFEGLTELLSVDLHGNQLTGQFPKSLFLESLKALDLSKNQLSGPIPDNFYTSKGIAFKVSEIILSNNKFDGPFPSSISDYGLSFVSFLGADLRNNQFTGSLPNSTGLMYLIKSQKVFVGGNSKLCIPTETYPLSLPLCPCETVNYANKV